LPGRIESPPDAARESRIEPRGNPKTPAEIASFQTSKRLFLANPDCCNLPNNARAAAGSEFLADDKFLFKTPNRWHYMPVIAQLTPTRFHKFFNRLRGRAAVDTFPTLYRANSTRTIHRLSARSGFAVKSLRFVEGRPEYLRFSTLTYLMGATYERLMNRFDVLSRFRIVIIGALEKTPGS
jgi:hypothetical protein